MVLLAVGLFGRAASAQTYNQVACCYSDTGNCTVVQGQITSGTTDSLCASPTGTAWLLEVQTTTPISNPRFVQQTTEGNGWVGICPQFSAEFFSDLCFSATGSPLLSNGSIKLVNFNLNSTDTFALNCTTKPVSGTCPSGMPALDSQTCCGSPAQFQYAGFTTGLGFAEAIGTTQGVFTPAPPPPVPALTPTTTILLGVGLAGLGLAALFRKRWT